MSITLRDCATTAPLGPAVPFAVDVPCRRDDERKRRHYAVRARPALARDTESGRTQAATTFTARFVAMVLFDTPPAPPAPGFQAGWQVVASTFTLADSDRLDRYGDRPVLRRQPAALPLGVSDGSGRTLQVADGADADDLLRSAVGTRAAALAQELDVVAGVSAACLRSPSVIRNGATSFVQPAAHVAGGLSEPTHVRKLPNAWRYVSKSARVITGPCPGTAMRNGVAHTSSSASATFRDMRSRRTAPAASRDRRSPRRRSSRRRATRRHR